MLKHFQMSEMLMEIYDWSLGKKPDAWCFHLILNILGIEERKSADTSWLQIVSLPSSV